MGAALSLAARPPGTGAQGAVGDPRGDCAWFPRGLVPSERKASCSPNPNLRLGGCGELFQPLGGGAALQTRAGRWAPAPVGGRAGSASGVRFSFWFGFSFPLWNEK